LNEFPQEDRPPVQAVFQTYHLMVALGMLMILLAVVASFQRIRGKLFDTRWLLIILVPAFILPHIANLVGWMAAEMGRQPWVVQGILRTKDAISQVVTAEQVWFSLILFTGVYTIIGILFIYLLIKKIKHGPEPYEELEAPAA